jgi:hypothetical protein
MTSMDDVRNPIYAAEPYQEASSSRINKDLLNFKNFPRSHREEILQMLHPQMP